MVQPVKQAEPKSPEDIVIRSNPIDEFLYRFIQHFPADGVDLPTKTLNGSKAKYKHPENQSYRHHWLTAVTSFLGLPNRLLKPGHQQSWKNIGRNFVGWQHKRTPLKNFINMCILVPLHSMTLPFKLFINVFKVVFEVLPRTIAACFYGLYIKGEKLYKDQLKRDEYRKGVSKLTNKEKFKYYFLLASSKALALSALFMGWLFSLVYGIFSCVLSPIDNIRQIWHDKKLSPTMKVILLIVAVSASTFFYAVFLPLLLKKLVLASAPYIASHLPTFISNAIVPVLEALGHLLAPVVTVISKILSLGIANTAAVFAAIPVFIAISALFGTLISTLGVVISEKLNALREKWHGAVASSDKKIYLELSRNRPINVEAREEEDELLAEKNEENEDEHIVEQWVEFTADGEMIQGPAPPGVSANIGGPKV